jgi:hypothetical protein
MHYSYDDFYYRQSDYWFKPKGFEPYGKEWTFLIIHWEYVSLMDIYSHIKKEKRWTGFYK